MSVYSWLTSCQPKDDLKLHCSKSHPMFVALPLTRHVVRRRMFCLLHFVFFLPVDLLYLWAGLGMCDYSTEGCNFTVQVSAVTVVLVDCI